MDEMGKALGCLLLLLAQIGLAGPADDDPIVYGLSGHYLASESNSCPDTTCEVLTIAVPRESTDRITITLGVDEIPVLRGRWQRSHYQVKASWQAACDHPGCLGLSSVEGRVYLEGKDWVADLTLEYLWIYEDRSTPERIRVAARLERQVTTAGSSQTNDTLDSADRHF